MTIEEIKKLISQGESRTLELKKSTGELKDGMHSACAFMNTDGGWLIFGITPKSLKIVGQQVNDETRQEIANALTWFEPSIDVKVEYIDVPNGKNGEQIIVMHFLGWNWGKHPYTYHGCPYYKPESITKIMPQDMYDERVQASDPQRFAWEGKQAIDITIADLDEKRVREAVRLGVESGRLSSTAEGQSTEEVLSKFGLLCGGHPINAAVMLFAKSATRYPQLLLRMARFRGVDKNYFIDSQRAKGNFFDLLDAGMAFCFKHLSLSGEINGLRREEKLEIPVSALREALINALCHRQYDQPSGSVSLAIFDDRIEIINPGRFPNAITPESIKLPHDSFPYNPIIADVLYLSTYLESWGSGAKRIIDACKEDFVPEPIWLSENGCITVTFQRQNGQKTARKRLENGQKTAKKQFDDWPETKRQIVNAIESNPFITITELEKELQKGHTTIKKYLSELKSEGVLHREGPAKGGHWVLILTNDEERFLRK